MRTLIALSVIVLLAGCSQTTGASRNANYEVDKNYVSQVESTARMMPLRVYWVNPPTKPTEDDDNPTEQRD